MRHQNKDIISNKTNGWRNNTLFHPPFYPPFICRVCPSIEVSLGFPLGSNTNKKNDPTPRASDAGPDLFQGVGCRPNFNSTRIHSQPLDFPTISGHNRNIPAGWFADFGGGMLRDTKGRNRIPTAVRKIEAGLLEVREGFHKLQSTVWHFPHM